MPLSSPQEREDLRGQLGRVLEERPVPAVVEQYQARVSNVVEDRDPDPKATIRSWRPWTEEDRRPYAEQVQRAHSGLCRDPHLHLSDAVD